MATFSEPQWEHSVEASGCIVLGCQKCAEAIVLLGLEEDWHEEGRDTFSCECGEKLTIASNSVDERAFSVRQLLRRPGNALNGVRRNLNGA